MFRFISFDEAMDLEIAECSKLRQSDVKRTQVKYQKLREQSPRCPHCGTPEGFAMGTGDCGCETTFEVGM